MVLHGDAIEYRISPEVGVMKGDSLPPPFSFPLFGLLRYFGCQHLKIGSSGELPLLCFAYIR